MRLSLILSVLDQAALSAFNFVLALMLIRYWSGEPEVFGVYAVILAVSLALISVQNALVGQLTVLRARVRDEEHEDALLSMFWTANAAIMAAALAGTFAAMPGALTGGGASLALAAALYIAGTLLREYTRSYHFSALKVGAVLTVDLISLTLSATAIAAAWYYWSPLSLSTLFFILAASQALASIPAILPHRRHFRLAFGKEARDAYRVVWHEQSKWALLGVIATELQHRGYIFVVAAVFGPLHVALLQAAALLFRPLQLIVHAWGKLARVILARHFAAGRRLEARTFTLKSLSTIALMYAGFLALLWLAWPLIQTHMFKGEFASLETVVLLWSVATGIIIAQGVMSVEAQSMIKFKELSHAAILGALTCAATLVPVTLIGDPRGSILAVAAGQFVAMCWIYRILATSGRAAALDGEPAAGDRLAVEGKRL